MGYVNILNALNVNIQLMKKSIQNKGLLKKVVWDFYDFTKKHKSINRCKLDDYGIIRTPEDYENPDEGITWMRVKYSNNKPLLKISQDLQKEFDCLFVDDIFHILPQILLKGYNFIELFKKSDNINIDYYWVISNYINFVPNTKKPENFSDYASNLDFFEEIILKTLNHMDKQHSEYIFNYTLIIPFSHNVWLDDVDLKIENLNNNIYLQWKEESLHIEWNYNGWSNIKQTLLTALNHLDIMCNILEINETIQIESEDKWMLSLERMSNVRKPDEIWLSYTTNFDESFFFRFQDFQRYLERFMIKPFYSTNPKLFYLLSDSLIETNLSTASYLLGSDKNRYEWQEFLRYWMAIEVLLWSPQFNIKETLKSEFSNWFPNPQKDYIEYFWKIRNHIVHRGNIYVERDDLSSIKRISKNLFYKMIVEKSDQQ